MDQVSHVAHLVSAVPTFGCVYIEVTHDVKNRYVCCEDMLQTQHTVRCNFHERKTHIYKKCKKLISQKLDLLCLCPVSTPDGKNKTFRC